MQTTVTAAIEALRHYHSTPFPTVADRVAAERAVTEFAETSGLTFQEATQAVTGALALARRQEDPEAAAREAEYREADDARCTAADLAAWYSQDH